MVIDYVEVPEERRGFHVSQCLVWGIARIFRGDIVALTPARMTQGGSDELDELVEDIVKFEGLGRHWERAGFVRLPETDVMLLPIGNR